MEQLALAEKQGIGLLVDVMSKTEDVDSDSDSSVDEDTRLGGIIKGQFSGEARATAWDAVKAYSNPPQVNPNDNDWQSLMDDSWNEFMSNVKDKQARKTSARMFRLRGLGLFTEAEVTQWLLDADDSAQKNGCELRVAMTSSPFPIPSRLPPFPPQPRTWTAASCLGVFFFRFLSRTPNSHFSTTSCPKVFWLPASVTENGQIHYSLDC